MLFADRQDAGQQLARKLEKYRNEKPFVFALPRGGVVVGYEVAKALGAPFDVMVAYKLGAPRQPELGFGAIAPNGIRVLNHEIVRLIKLTESELERVTGEAIREMARRLEQYRNDLPMPDVTNRTVILVDDGLATGMTALAAIRAIKRMNPGKIILAVPVGSPETVDSLRQEADDVVCVEEPADFMAVGVWYRQFGQTSDEEVIDLLRRSKQEVEI